MASLHPVSDRMRTESSISELDIGAPLMRPDGSTQNQPNFSRPYPHKLTEPERRLAEQAAREPHNCHPLQSKVSMLEDQCLTRASNLQHASRRCPDTNGADSRPSILDPAVFEPLGRPKSCHTGYDVAVDHASVRQREASPRSHYRRDSKQADAEEDVCSIVAGELPTKASSEAERNALHQLAAARLSSPAASNSSFKREETPLDDFPSGTATDASPRERRKDYSSSGRLYSRGFDGRNGIATNEHLQINTASFGSHGVHGSTLVDDPDEIVPNDHIGAALDKSASEHLTDIHLQFEADRIIAKEIAAVRDGKPADKTWSSESTTTRKGDASHNAEDLPQAAKSLNDAAGKFGMRKKRKITHEDEDVGSADHSNSHDAGPGCTPKRRWREPFKFTARKPVKTDSKNNPRKPHDNSASKHQAGHMSGQPRITTSLSKEIITMKGALKQGLEHIDGSSGMQKKGGLAAWYDCSTLICSWSTSADVSQDSRRHPVVHRHWPWYGLRRALGDGKVQERLRFQCLRVGAFSCHCGHVHVLHFRDIEATWSRVNKNSKAEDGRRERSECWT